MAKNLNPRLLIGVVAITSGSAFAAPRLDLPDRDKRFTCGSISYTVQTAASKAQNAPRKPAQLWFSTDGRFREHLDKPDRFGEGTKYAEFAQGGTWHAILVAKLEGVTTTFLGTDPLPRDENPMFFIAEKPGFALGLGLGKLKSVQTHQEDQALVLEGELGDRTTVTAEFSSQGVPRQLRREFEGKALNEWTYEGELSTGNGLKLPRSSTYRVATGSNAIERRFEILNAEIGQEPANSDLALKWFAPGQDVEDRRVEPTVYWTYDELKSASHGKTSLTPDELLVLSKSRAEYLTQSEQGKRAADENRSSNASSMWAAMGSVFLATFVGGGVVIRKVRR